MVSELAPTLTGRPDVLSTPSPLKAGTVGTLTPRWTSDVSLRGRQQLFWRRRLALRMRNWMGIGLIVCYSMTLFAVTLFSLIGR
jgi:hypothetical protein